MLRKPARFYSLFALFVEGVKADGKLGKELMLSAQEDLVVKSSSGFIGFILKKLDLLVSSVSMRFL